MIRTLHKELLHQETTAVRLAEGYFDAIEKRDSEIGAYLTLMKESALREAHEVDERIRQGEETDLLAGIPCALKDNMCMKGVRTTAASKILDNYIAPYDATVVKELRGAGAIILGKTNMDEFAMGSSTESSAYQKTKNPRDTSRVPGGSSGGSAAAVAGNMAVFALGSDTGGSIRQPASLCGVVGLKPTYGRVSRHGLIAMASSLDQIGPLTQTVEDAAIVLSRIAGEDALDATSAESGGKFYEHFLSGDITGKRIGIPKEYFSNALDVSVRAVAERAIERFRSLGADIVPISLPSSHLALPTYYIIMPAEVSSNLARLDGIRYGLSIDNEEISILDKSGLFETYLDTRQYGFGTEVKRRIMLGTYALSAGYYDAYYSKAQKVRTLLRREFEQAFLNVDFIFSPTAPEPAFPFDSKANDPLSMYLSDIYTVTANLTGVPAISFPIGFLEEGGRKLPLGGQLMGKWFDEEGMLNAAHAFEQSFQ
ncbi:MAG: Asp-tRNA(Asn)/Glu-tRNA(Gln) amidotransferase subunit GatA [Candidatus Moraniibacteriota bacterium]|nr:MAG: Asp-tRNA(Asn)/Glu-tRNA(Gln) amidotransferase subunit GatA [Candidatus Moranbacteria bacterium]